jgi:hypothetical protein
MIYTTILLYDSVTEKFGEQKIREKITLFSSGEPSGLSGEMLLDPHSEQ